MYPREWWWDDWDMVLIENYPCANENELKSNLNRIIPTRTEKEYYEDNKETILAQRKNYYRENAKELIEKAKIYSQNHSEKLAKGKKYIVLEVA